MVYINTLIKINLNFNETFQPVAEIRYVPFKVHWSYGVLFCHSSAQELFILLDVRLTMSTVVMGWRMVNFE